LHHPKIVGGKISAVHGITTAGTGWRAVCRGIYLGASCSLTELEAITKGKRYFVALKEKVTGLKHIPTQAVKAPNTLAAKKIRKPRKKGAAQ
jgi:hypothetical protein